MVDSDETPGGCWVWCGDVHVRGPKVLAVGAPVNLEWEAARQDGYAYQAIRVWPVGQDPVDDAIRVQGPSAAYRSHLELRFDEP